MSKSSLIAKIKKTKAFRAAADCREKLDASKMISRLRKTPAEDRPIRVGFIAQMPEVWNKNAPVFETMLKDGRFDAKLIVVPSYDLTRGKLNGYGAELAFFESHYPKACILTSETLGDDFGRLAEQGFDYVVYQRCWETYLPSNLHAKSVLKFARTIYIPYCFDLTHEPKSYYKTAFFRYTYRTFAPSKAQCERMKNCGCPRTVFEGYPTLDRPAPDPDRTSEDRIKTVLWTPRWTEADFYGGTSFYDCRESFLAFQKSHPELRCVFRPHPLLYENAVKEGKMSETEMADLLSRYQRAGIIIDPNADVNDTLAGTDVLLTDFSSIIMNAFLYGIPIVYLKDLPRTPLYEPFESISGTLYYPKNWEEAKTQAARLLENEDPMKEKREALLLGVLEENKDSAKKITEAIAADYFGK